MKVWTQNAIPIMTSAVPKSDKKKGIRKHEYDDDKKRTDRAKITYNGGATYLCRDRSQYIGSVKNGIPGELILTIDSMLVS